MLSKLWSVENFFFFQAEDGIRDVAVTGVQTCALPILVPHFSSALMLVGEVRNHTRPAHTSKPSRSEERRVGKECRSRWSPDDYKKKKLREHKHLALC